METVMKKLFVLFLTLFTSAILFFSCDPHAEGNTVTISINTESINSILKNTAARTADPRPDDDNSLCVYALLKGSEGSKYEKTVYINPNNGNSEKVELTLSMIPYREEYELFVYLVRNGKSVDVYYKPLELNRFGVTRVNDINLIYSQDGTVYEPYFMYTVKNPDPANGNYKVIISNYGYEDTYKVTNQATVKFSITEDLGYTYDFYILHNDKQTNVTPYYEYSDPEDINQFTYLCFDYTFKEEGDYRVACRQTSLSTHQFATGYLPVTFKSNKIDTNFVIYDNTSGRKVWLMDSIQDTTSQYPDYEDASANNFDFCWDEYMNFYTTNGTSVFKNNGISTFASSNGETIRTMNCSLKGNYLVCINEDSSKIGFKDITNQSSWAINWNYMPTNITSGNGTRNILYATVSDSELFVIYSELQYIYGNTSKQYNKLFVSRYTINDDKTGTFILTHVTDYMIAALNYQGPGDSGFVSSYEVQDAIVYNNNLYFLCNVPGWFTLDNRPDVCISHLLAFGFIAKINLTTNEVSIAGQSDMTKTATDATLYSNPYYYDFGWDSRYYSSDDSKQFIAPQKIIAIKPKELVIADDGFLYWASDSWGYNFKNSNRVLTVELDNFTVSKMQKLNDITWLREKTSNFTASGPFDYVPN